jgi:aldose sugar dehydrogenase
MGKRTGAAFAVLTAIVFTLSVFDLFGGRIASARVTEAGEGAISTTLLRLRWQAVDMRKHGAHSASGTSIVAFGNRILLAEQMGSFFEVRLDGDKAEVRRIPLRLDTNYAALREYSKELSKGVADAADRDRFVGVTGLRFLADGRTLAASFSHWTDDEKCVTLRLALARLDNDGMDTVEGWRTVFVSDPCIPVRDETRFIGQQAGGGLVEVRPGILYLAVGDFAHDGVENPRSFAQNPAASYGKIFEIDIAKGTHRIVSIGHRNPQGLTVDSRGRVWATEHGPKAVTNSI